jgi:hypothetical protein
MLTVVDMVVIARSSRHVRLASLRRAHSSELTRRAVPHQVSPSSGWAGRRRRARNLLVGAWELASGRIIWRALLLAPGLARATARAGTLPDRRAAK